MKETQSHRGKDTVTNNIKPILRRQGRSQAWLADKLGKSYVVTTNYCNNKTQPSLYTLYQIADILEVDVKDLVGLLEPRLSHFRN